MCWSLASFSVVAVLVFVDIVNALSNVMIHQFDPEGRSVTLLQNTRRFPNFLGSIGLLKSQSSHDFLMFSKLNLFLSLFFILFQID
jgi:hypothetical protein